MNDDAWVRGRRGGYTVIETLVVVALLAVAAIWATPEFVVWRTRDQVEARASALLGTFAYARNESVRQGARITVCRIDAARRCLPPSANCPSGAADWSCGWAVMAEAGSVLRPLRIQASVQEVAIASQLAAIVFTPPAGQAVGAMRSFDIGPRVAVGGSGPRWRRCIRVSSGGRTRITEGACGTSS